MLSARVRIVFLRVSLALCFLGCLFGQQASLPPMGYKPVLNWPPAPEAWNLYEPSGVAVDREGNVYVFNRSPHPLLKLTSEGKLIKSYCEGGVFVDSHGVRIDRDDNIWAVDRNGQMIFKINQEGRILMVLGRRGQKGTAHDNFNRPTDVAFAPNGDVFISDGYGNSRVIKFDKNGKYLLEWGKKGSAPGEFNLPHAIVLDTQGRVYVGDRENYRVQIFDVNGKFLGQWTNVGSPWGLDLTPDKQHILLSDGHNNRVLLLNLEGQILGVQGSPGKAPGEFIHAHAIASAPNGDFYVAETVNWRVQKFVKR